MHLLWCGPIRMINADRRWRQSYWKKCRLWIRLLLIIYKSGEWLFLRFGNVATGGEAARSNRRVYLCRSGNERKENVTPTSMACNKYAVPGINVWWAGRWFEWHQVRSKIYVRWLVWIDSDALPAQATVAFYRVMRVSVLFTKFKWYHSLLFPSFPVETVSGRGLMVVFGANACRVHRPTLAMHRIRVTHPPFIAE
jgi:hypothetical protein